MSQTQLEKKVADYLRKSQALEDNWHRPITAKQLQAELDRMAKYTKQPEVLRELFDALGNDSFVIAECLARAVLAERLVGGQSGYDRKLDSNLTQRTERGRNVKTVPIASYMLPTIFDGSGCVEDTWTLTSGPPDGRLSPTAVWTGTEMIIWGGGFGENDTNTGGRYDPATDSWTATSTSNAPSARDEHTAVWTGSEMIVWGGDAGFSLNAAGKYRTQAPSPNGQTPTPTSTPPDETPSPTPTPTSTPIPSHGTGGRYDPSTDSWTATSTSNAPSARGKHTAVWTGTEMIVWGGFDGIVHLKSGGRYNPAANSWTATSSTNVPETRSVHTAVWSGSEMIVWGGFSGFNLLNTGGRYNPGTDSWTATSASNAPTARDGHTAIWTGSEMVVWGGDGGNFNFLTRAGNTIHGRICGQLRLRLRYPLAVTHTRQCGRAAK